MPDSDANAAVIVLSGLGDPLLGREVGGYVIDAPLSEGGMGVVYRARHPFLGRSFAVKVMRPEFADDRTLSGNFVREAQTLSALKHPHIIDIVGFGDLDAQRQYMVMEFLEGRSLAQELEAEGALGVRRVLELIEPILSALEAAHSVGVIHRDLKPSNVFLSRVSGGGEVVKLLDFGLAKQQPHRLDLLAASAQAGMSVIAGTPEYISPEQAQGKPASERSDLYSFGVMLFEMLTGHTPFDAADGEQRISELMRQHIHQPAPSLEGQGEAPIPDELAHLVEELLRKDPAQRPASAAVVRQRVGRMLRQLQRETTQARPNPLLAIAEPAEEELVARGRRTRRGPIAALGAVVLGLGAALAFMPASSAPGEEVVALTQAAPPAVAPVPQPPLAPALPAQRSPNDDAGELTPLPKVSPRPPVVRRAAPALQVTSFECEPDEAWRSASRAHLQELQQLAATKGASGWARFSALEPRLSKDIEAAADGAQCDAVDRRIRQLARELSP